MNKVKFFALAATVALGLGGSKGTSEGDAILTIQLDGISQPKHSRSVEDPATGGTLDVDGATSLIFVSDHDGNISQAVNIVPAQAVTGTGQELPVPVAIGSSVYIVANIPAAEFDAVKALTTLAAVKAKTSAISTQVGYLSPTMANVGAEVEVDNTNIAGGKKSLTVQIEPLVARLEVIAMQAVADAAGNVITDYDVTGIFVSEYYPNFDYTGAAPSGDAVVSLQDGLESAADAVAKATVYTGWAAYMKDVNGPWAAVNKIAKEPATGDVWAYNVVAKGIPHIIIRLENIDYTNASGASATLAGPRYLTIEGYEKPDTSLVAALERGEVYRVGTITAGNSNFQFNFSHLNADPYEESAGLVVKVEVLSWNIVDYKPVLRP